MSPRKKPPEQDESAKVLRFKTVTPSRTPETADDGSDPACLNMRAVIHTVVADPRVTMKRELEPLLDLCQWYKGERAPKIPPYSGEVKHRAFARLYYDHDLTERQYEILISVTLIFIGKSLDEVRGIFR